MTKKGQKDKQLSTKHYAERLGATNHTTTVCELRCSRRVSSSCSTI